MADKNRHINCKLKYEAMCYSSPNVNNYATFVWQTIIMFVSTVWTQNGLQGSTCLLSRVLANVKLYVKVYYGWTDAGSQLYVPLSSSRRRETITIASFIDIHEGCGQCSSCCLKFFYSALWPWPFVSKSRHMYEGSPWD